MEPDAFNRQCFIIGLFCELSWRRVMGRNVFRFPVVLGYFAYDIRIMGILEIL